MRDQKEKTLDASMLDISVAAVLGGHDLSDWALYTEDGVYSAHCARCEGTIFISSAFNLPLLTPMCGVDDWSL